jgi:hypothetical protein
MTTGSYDPENMELICRALEIITARGRSSGVLERSTADLSKALDDFKDHVTARVERLKRRDPEVMRQIDEVVKRIEEQGPDPAVGLQGDLEEKLIDFKDTMKLSDHVEQTEKLDTLFRTLGHHSLIEGLIEATPNARRDPFIKAIKREPWRTRLAVLNFGDFVRGVADATAEFWHVVDSLFPMRRLDDDEATVVRWALRDESAIRAEVAWRLASDFVSDLPERVDRSLRLSQQALLSPASGNIGRYLTMLRRCYVAGFLPECVILCRSILEGLLQSAFEQHHLPLPEKKGAWISSAEKEGWLAAEDARRAGDIWQRGNKAVHQEPERVADVAGTIDDTLAVARRLQSC